MAQGVGRVSAANIARALAGIDFPSGKDQLIEHAGRKVARGEAVLQALQELPEREYQHMADVLEAYGAIR